MLFLLLLLSAASATPESRAAATNLLAHPNVVGGWSMQPCEVIKKDPRYLFQSDVWTREQEQKLLNGTIWKDIDCSTGVPRIRGQEALVTLPKEVPPVTQPKEATLEPDGPCDLRVWPPKNCVPKKAASAPAADPQPQHDWWMGLLGR